MNILSLYFFLLSVSHLVLLGGCASTGPLTSVSTGEDIKGALSPKTDYAPLSETQLQAMVMNFEDLYVMSVWQAYDEIRRSTNNPEIRATAQSLKVRSNSNAITIAAGRNPAVNLLDMLVFVSLGRHAVENHWVPEVFGSPGEPLVRTYRKLENEVWKISARVLSEDQQKTLRALIQEWIAANPGQYYIAAIRLSDFAEIQGMSRASQMKAGTLLADVEKALAVAEQGLLVSERALFYVERLPRLVTLQTELMLDQIAAAPDAEHLRTNLSKLSAASERLSLVVADLPRYVREERQATVDHVFSHFRAERQQVMNDLASQESRLQGVFKEVAGLIDRVTPLTDKLHATVRSADALYRLVDATTPSKLPQYNALLEKAIVAMDKLTGILAEVTPLYAAISRDANALNDPIFGKIMGLADHLFWRGMLLIAFFLVGLLAVMLAYRFLSAKLGTKLSTEKPAG
ncbi:MAG: hypothetical protein HXY45_15215 [Syntrophaceae bacterium]|nr:hypothetical protein [Syntrophaceae bacterium]